MLIQINYHNIKNENVLCQIDADLVIFLKLQAVKQSGPAFLAYMVVRPRISEVKIFQQESLISDLLELRKKNLQFCITVSPIGLYCSARLNLAQDNDLV